MTLRTSGTAALVVVALLTWCAPGAHADGVIGPILPYFGLAQSPFNGLPFSYFHLETFEEPLAPTVPGVTLAGGVVIGSTGLTDSVEGIDNGHDYFSGCGICGVTFTFDAGVLGNLPTHVGIVWTDGDGPNRYFKAFDANNNQIGSTIIDSTQKFFSTGGDGLASNYRFFGAIDSIGIKSIFIANDGGGIEVDDLQYGFLAPNGTAVPEPSSFVLTLLGGGLLVAGTLRRRLRS
jgi:PEP-CTERM motif-containing protein